MSTACTAPLLAVRGPAAAAALWLAAGAVGAAGAKKKPLFEYDDHYVMLNDYGRNEFYHRALSRAVSACGAGCSVLDVGAGSGLLSMIAAGLGASQVLGLEANPALAELAERTLARNRLRFQEANVTILAELSSKVGPEQLPLSRLADVLVTETFGTMLLGEGAMTFVPDARQRLLKAGGVMIPAGGCQYVTLVEAPDFAASLSPGEWRGLNLSHLEMLQDNVYWKATLGASRSPLTSLSERICVLEVDWYRDTKESVPENRTFRIRATRSGTVHAALFDWDIWADASKSDILSTAAGARRFAGDVAWGQLLQLQEEAGEDWRYGPVPVRLAVQEGEWLELGVEFIARGISAHVRVRRAPAAPPGPSGAGGLPATGSPVRMRGINRGDVLEANEFLLPLAGDAERHEFYAAALSAAVARFNSTGRSQPSVLDCSGSAGVPALLAAREHGLHALALESRSEFARAVRRIAEDNGLGELVEAYAADPRDLVESLLPLGERADIVVVDPPGTPLHGHSPFALLPSVRKYLLKEDGLVVPAGACLEVGLVESEDVAHMFSVPGGRWEDVDLTVWNEETRRQHVLERLVPYTKWFGPHSTMSQKWLSTPRCVFQVDLAEYGRAAAPAEETTVHPLAVTADGQAHALVARWVLWAEPAGHAQRLGPESSYLGRALTWPSYVQALAAPGTGPGVLDPVPLRAGEAWSLEVTVRQGASKLTAVAGPEFSLRLAGRAPDAAPSGTTEL